MADPDFKVRGGVSKKFFWSFGLPFGHKIRGHPGPLGPSPRSAAASYSRSNFTCGFISVTLSTGREILIKIESLCQVIILGFFAF